MGVQVKDKPNQGWTKELRKTPKAETKKPFNYKKPVNRLDKPNDMGLNSRSRSFKTVPQDKTTNFAVEQNQAKANKRK